MTCLGDLAKLIRSKNAGPFILTFDIMFDDEAAYRRVIGAGVITKEAFARLYSVAVDDITLVHHAADRVTAEALAKTFSHLALHYPIPEWRGLITGLAYPFTPAELDKGEVYKFSINHVLYPDDPCEMFRFEFLEVG